MKKIIILIVLVLFLAGAYAGWYFYKRNECKLDAEALAVAWTRQQARETNDTELASLVNQGYYRQDVFNGFFEECMK